MKKNSTIRVKNEMPELLEALCEHPDCPDWLKDGIWDVFNDQSITVSYKAAYWRSMLNDMVNQPREDAESADEENSDKGEAKYEWPTVLNGGAQ
jgi:hypothetical protein